ncbi:MAG: Hpt domain-containing protein [Candidatus Aminicenantales bacterium]
MPDTVNSEDSQPIDFSTVLERIDGDASFLQDLLNLYFQEFADKKHLLEKALAGGDSTQIQEVGHSLKGASANLSLAPLQRLALAIEKAGREKDLEKARQAIGALGTEFLRLKAFLEGHPLEDLA